MASRDAFAVGVVGKKQLPGREARPQLAPALRAPWTPKISDYHAAHCFSPRLMLNR